MPRISHAEVYVVDLAVETCATDAGWMFEKQETVFVEIRTDDGGTGTGYLYTIGTGGTAVLALLRDYLLPCLVGADPRRTEAIWRTPAWASTGTATPSTTGGADDDPPDRRPVALAEPEPEPIDAPAATTRRRPSGLP